MADQAAASEKMNSGARTRVFTSLGSDIDLTTSYQGWAQGQKPLPARWLCFDGGALVVTDMSGYNSTIPVAYAGVPIPGQYKAIVASGTGATSVLVLW